MRTVLTMKTRLMMAAVVAAVAVPLAGCTASDATGEVVATNAVLASLVQMAVGDSLHVVSIVPDGKDPHEFQPSAGDIARVAGARIVVSNGFGYEPTLRKPIGRAQAGGVTVFDAERAVPSLDDPHWFTDPVAAGQVLTALVPVLEKATGNNYGETFAAATDELRATVESARGELATVPGGKCDYAVEHVLLSPFGTRFGCSGSVVLNAGSRIPNAEPSAADIERFVGAITSKGIAAVVEDRSEPSRILAEVSRQTGAALVKVDVHGMGGARSYPEYIVNMARALAGALS